MTYKELQDVVQTLNTGSLNPDSFDTVARLVLGKMARRRLSSRAKLATLNANQGTVTPSGATALDLKVLLPDYFAMRVDANEGMTFELTGDVIYLPAGYSGNISFFYYSKYLVLDQDGITEKETPENNDDTFLFPSVLDDVVVEGILLYITRREKDDREFQKDVIEWEKRINEAIFYN